jgi:hypothetical protein
MSLASLMTNDLPAEKYSLRKLTPEAHLNPLTPTHCPHPPKPDAFKYGINGPIRLVTRPLARWKDRMKPSNGVLLTGLIGVTTHGFGGST